MKVPQGKFQSNSKPLAFPDFGNGGGFPSRVGKKSGKRSKSKE